MKKLLTFAASILLLSVVLSSCSNFAGVTDSDQAGRETIGWNDAQTEDIDDSVNNSTQKTDNSISAQMDIKSYMQYFVNYFHEPYREGDDLSRINLLSLSFLVSLHHSDSLDFVKTFENDQRITIKGSGLNEEAKMLFGSDVDISLFRKYLFGSFHVYDPEEDTYIVLYSRGYWGGDNYYLDEYTPLEISETDTTATVVAVVYYLPTLGVMENMRTMEYTFEKVTYNGMLFYRICEVKEVK